MQNWANICALFLVANIIFIMNSFNFETFVLKLLQQLGKNHTAKKPTHPHFKLFCKVFQYLLWVESSFFEKVLTLTFSTEPTTDLPCNHS